MGLHLLPRTARPLLRTCSSQSRTRLGLHNSKDMVDINRGECIACRSMSFVPTKTTPFESNIVRLLQYEIKYEIDTNPPTKIPHNNIPFTVKDKPGEQWMALHRKYGKEHIKVEATMIDLGTGDHYEEVGKDEVSCSINLAITISKGEGTPYMVIGCSAHPDEIIIDKVAILEDEPSHHSPYEGPDFREMGEDLQKAFKKFLEERGINSDLFNFLYEYMLNKGKEEYLRWLHTLKSFIEKESKI